MPAEPTGAGKSDVTTTTVFRLAIDYEVPNYDPEMEGTLVEAVQQAMADWRHVRFVAAHSLGPVEPIPTADELLAKTCEQCGGYGYRTFGDALAGYEQTCGRCRGTGRNADA